MRVEEGPESSDVAVVDVVQLEGWALGALLAVMTLSEELDTVEDCLKGIAQVVDDDDIISGFEELERGVGTDEAKTACDEDILAVKGEVVETCVEEIIEEDRASCCRGINLGREGGTRWRSRRIRAGSLEEFKSHGKYGDRQEKGAEPKLRNEVGTV